MHVTFFSTYPPTACGLATFTENLREALPPGGQQATGEVVAVASGSAKYEEGVVYAVRKEEARDYEAAAEFLNATSTDVVSVQHEFGIFGGSEGRHVTTLLNALEKPAVTTLHTVLPDPPARYRRALEEVAACSDHLVVMSHQAKALLRETYGVPASHVSVVPHGVPDLPFEKPAGYKEALGVGAAGRTVLLTFGLLGPSKGIELVLEALPGVVEAHPDVLYLVLGATHPEIKRQRGEAYRQRLKKEVRRRGLSEHVRFVDEYVRSERLHDFLRAADVYVTPYPGRDQITSGTLAYAVGTGKAVVSTPYLYAEELLADGRGRLVPFEDAAAMRDALSELAGDPAARQAMARRAWEHGRGMTWSRVGERYAELFDSACRPAGRPGLQRRASSAKRGKQRVAPGAPEARVTLRHLAALTDDTGIFQHVAYGTPDRDHGYCTDDAGRALVVALRHRRRTRPARSHEREQATRLATTYLGFLAHAQREDGRFDNFMRYDRCFIDLGDGSEDTLGRALWGLGATVAYGPDAAARVMARQRIERTLALPVSHPRALAYVLCGLDLYLHRFPGALEVRRVFAKHAEALLAHYEATRASGWRWFSDALTYANAKMPEALLRAYRRTDDTRFREAGLDTLGFLLSETYDEEGGYFDFVGNRGWRERADRGGSSQRAYFDQQPIEAGYTAEACALAYDLTEEACYRERAVEAVAWLFGRNRHGQPLYDAATGACADGLMPGGISRNAGAESAIAGQLGLLALAQLAKPERPDASGGPASAPQQVTSGATPSDATHPKKISTS